MVNMYMRILTEMQCLYIYTALSISILSQTLEYMELRDKSYVLSQQTMHVILVKAKQPIRNLALSACTISLSVYQVWNY